MPIRQLVAMSYDDLKEADYVMNFIIAWGVVSVTLLFSIACIGA